MDPAAFKLGLPYEDLLLAQVFQNACCNWRCWYCYVPYSLLQADQSHSRWLSASEIVDLYSKERNAPHLIDLSGGQPDLTPEWIPWMMRELMSRNLADQVYLWSDDNLSNDYFWRYLGRDDIALVREYRNYGKVCCFKGFNPASFAFNTRADPSLFAQQFKLFERNLQLGIDIYGYSTFTTDTDSGLSHDISAFVDRLQSISVNLPLRVIPLEIRPYSPAKQRMRPGHEHALRLQWHAISAWKSELEHRFSLAMRSLPIHEIPIRYERHDIR